MQAGVRNPGLQSNHIKVLGYMKKGKTRIKEPMAGAQENIVAAGG